MDVKESNGVVIRHSGEGRAGTMPE